jgi:hypothetical protein
MATLEILNVHDHADLRVAAPSAGNRHFVQIVTDEFESVASRFPILFTKHPETGDFYAGAMLGFKLDENIVGGLPDGQAADRLFDVEREGFFIAEENILIDREHRRFASGSAQPLFEDREAPAAALRRVQRALSRLHAGLPRTEQFIKRLLGLKLIEPIDLSFNFDDGERLILEGLYTISRDALADLDDATVIDLFRDHNLAHAYAIIGSLQHIPRLAKLRNDRLTAA